MFILTVIQLQYVIYLSIHILFLKAICCTCWGNKTNESYPSSLEANIQDTRYRARKIMKIKVNGNMRTMMTR